MSERIEIGNIAFLTAGREGIGAVRGISDTSLTIYVENAGEFIVPLSAVTRVQEQKVMLDPQQLDADLLDAIGHAHDREDPKLRG
jgi:hypothetical protein